MTTNKEWLFSLPLEEQYAWMESEHYELNPDCSAMLYKMFTENMKHEPCNDYEPKRETERDGDSRELIEADAGRIVRSAAKNANTDTLWAGPTFLLLDAVIELLDRQAAITERETTKRHELFCETCEAESDKRIAELTAELDAAKQQISQFDAPKSVETPENPASKCEISDFDDSRELLEADISKYLNYPSDCRAVYDYNAVIGWLDRQAAITAEETSNAWEEYRDATQREISELTAERDKLQELNEYHALQYELASEDADRLQAQVDELTQVAESKCLSFADRVRFVNEIDELNSRAERTCKQEERGWGTEGDHARVWLTCGHDCMVPTVQDLPNYCPNCGAKVVGE